MAFKWPTAKGTTDNEPEAKQRLQHAYDALFAGRGSKQDADIVLADLRSWTGFNTTHQHVVLPDQLQYESGRRAVYGYIDSFINATDEERNALDRAVREIDEKPLKGFDE